MGTAQRHAPRFRVGDWVSFIYGARQVWAQITEDRGQLGVNRRRLYGIRFGDEPGETVTSEMPEEDLTPVELDRDEVIEYLKKGGLIAILRSNLGGGKDQPQAWLAFDPHGRLTHTYNEERGLLGGGVVPFFALQGNQVFTPKVSEVTAFLSTFGLTHAEAEDVVRSVGTIP